MALILMEEAYIDVFVCVDLEAPAFTHIIMPLTLVYTRDILDWYCLFWFFWWQLFFQVYSDAESFLLT